MACQYFRELSRSEKYEAISQCRNTYTDPIPANPAIVSVSAFTLAAICLLALVILKHRPER